MTNISNRKDDHIQLALKVRHQSQSDSHFDRLTFEHSGLPEDKVLAYIWWNLAAANGHENASKNKGIIAKRMTSSQIAEAQKLSRECLRKNYKNC